MQQAVRLHLVTGSAINYPLQGAVLHGVLLYVLSLNMKADWFLI